MANLTLPVWPLILMVASFVGYLVLLKLPGAATNVMAFLTVAYFSAFVCAGLLWLRNPQLGVNRLDYRELLLALIFGATITALEFGYVSAYRLGWPVNTTGSTVNIMTAILMVPIGFVLFREHITLLNGIGLALCCAGLILMTWR